METSSFSVSSKTLKFRPNLKFCFWQLQLKKAETLNFFNVLLAESRAITQYIAHFYSDKGNQLVSLGSKDIAGIAMGIEIESHEFDPVGSKLVWEQVLKPLYGMTTDKTVVEEEEAKLAKVLDVYEHRLGESKYLASDKFTLVDLHTIPVIQYLLGTPTKKLFDERPHVSAWVADITSRPSAKKVL